MSEASRQVFEGFGGAKLALHRMGKGGRPLILLHGLFSSAEMNWIKFGHAALLAKAGFEVIMPDLRAHGRSAAPHDAAAYPPGVLVRDAQTLVSGLGLEPGTYDLGGFSLGARTAAACVIDGMQPRRLILAGMGLEGLSGWDRRAAFFIDAITRFDEVKRGDPAFMAVSFMNTMQVDRQAALLLLSAVDDLRTDQLAAITMPALVLCGEDDRDNGDPQALASALPQAHLVQIPGTHMSSVTQKEMGAQMAEFLLA